MQRKQKLFRLLAIGLVPLLALAAGCAEDTGDEDIGAGPAEPEPDVGPVEESVEPATEDEFGDDEAGLAEDDAAGI